MSETGDTRLPPATLRVEDIERALVLAREVAAATANGGAANMRIEHLRALFANGAGRVPPELIEAALQAAGLTVEPPLTERPESVALRVDRGRAALRRERPGKAPASAPAPDAAPPATPAGDEPPQRLTGVAAYRAANAATAAPPRPTTPSAGADAEPISLDAAQRIVAAEQSELRTAQSLAALMPALVVPVLAASFLGPLFGVLFAGLALAVSLALSRPGALANGRLGPLRMPASLARSFLLLSSGVAIGALGASLALIAAGGADREPADPNAPLDQPQTQTQPEQSTPTTEPRSAAPAEPSDTAASREAAVAERRRAERRREKRRERRLAQQEQREQQEQAGETAPSP